MNDENLTKNIQLHSSRGVSELRIRIRADIRMNFDIRNISCGCHADIANNKRIIF